MKLAFTLFIICFLTTLLNVEAVDRCRNKVSKDQIANAVNIIQRAKTFRWNNRTRSTTTSTASNARLSGLPTVNIPILWVVVQSSTRGSLTRGNNFLVVKQSFNNFNL